jgi:ankyrin repeat protein
MATEFGQEAVERALIDLGADVNKADDRGITPLLIGGHLGQAAIVQILRDAGAA